MDRRTVLTRCLGSAVMLAGGAVPALSAPKAVLWDRWTAHDPHADLVIDHDDWGIILDRWLITGSDGINRFAYRRIADEDRARLDGYVDALGRTAISSYDRAEQMAYWINLYNALTVKVILDHYPVDSIRDIDISPGFFSDGPWGKKLLTIEEETVSLDDIEHQILRPIWQDPRIHYAVNCASIGCPNLQPQPFSARRLDQQLDEAAIAFVNHPRGVTIDGGDLTVSSIYHWFKEDFGGRDAGVITHLKAFAEPALAMRLDDVEGIDDHDYDWRLNDAASGS